MTPKHLLTEIVKAMVDYPEDVEVREITGSGTSTIIFELITNVDDIGKVIGKSGSHAMALRTLLKAMGGKDKTRYWLEIEQ